MPTNRWIPIQAVVDTPLREVLDEIRVAVSRACGGIDDMHLLGDKALVIRTEIVPRKLPALRQALAGLGVRVTGRDIPAVDDLQADARYPVTLQITCLAGDTDGRVAIPNVPG